MLASGNGKPMQCVANLVRITRGECAYDRVKGIDPTLIDRPVSIVKPLLQEDIRWLIKTYEPRVDLRDIDLGTLTAGTGDFRINMTARAEE